ncbi:hypothetical protein OHC33_006191 [Knufia fluminis]|uniref:DUF3835 domain-containing protein n=1 Tax=Knufia fluminis TaxID=191047 RepID=A0AAN8ECX4_9EURO|nr:hypothetical protein OHC33_006191 [Knufia fluminis]
MDNDVIKRVEKQWLELEASITKLRDVLRHWQTLELDYEGLKDEFSGLEADTSKQDCLKLVREFEPEKIDEKEINELIEPSKGKVRSPPQVVEILSKRVEYVSKNIASLKDQIARVEKERNGLLEAQKPEDQDRSGLPVAEITEELDEDGNVISSTVQPQGDSASKVLGVLEKADVQPRDGVPGSGPAGSKAEITEAETSPGLKTKVSVPNDDSSDDESVTAEIVSAGASKAAAQGPTNSEDTEEEARLRQEMLQYGLGEVGNIVAELDLLDEQDNDVEDDEVDMEDLSGFDDDEYDDFSDEDESEDEDGRVKRPLHSEKYRKQMEDLQKQLGFQLENVGPTPDLPAEVRAQIEHLPPSEVQQYIETLPPTLRKQLEKPPPKEAARKAAIAREEAARSSLKDITTESDTTKPKKKSKKKVAFAPDLDIAPEPASQPKPPTTSETVIERSSSAPTPTSSKPSIINATVTERPTTSSPTAQPPKPKSTSKTSRFKADRSPNQQRESPLPLFPPPPMNHSSQPTNTPPTAPPNATHSTLIERSSPSTTTPAPPSHDPHDFDTTLQTRQIALEHHALRNKMIHDQGGYVRGGELENWGDEYTAPEYEDPRTGEVRRVSRFRAARMR